MLTFRSHLEKSLKDSQEQVADLRKRLSEVSIQYMHIKYSQFYFAILGQILFCPV